MPTSPGARRSRAAEAERGRTDDGLPADAAPAPATRGGVLPGQADRHAAARQELPPLPLPRLRPPIAAARRRPAGARARARRPCRNALLEPPPAPRGVLRHSLRRLRPAHAQPAPAPE